MNLYRAFVLAAALAFVVIVAGAYVRLEDVGLGVANVVLRLPLAAAHNAGAALLLASLVMLNFTVFRSATRSS